MPTSYCLGHATTSVPHLLGRYWVCVGSLLLCLPYTPCPKYWRRQAVSVHASCGPWCERLRERDLRTLDCLKARARSTVVVALSSIRTGCAPDCPTRQVENRMTKGMASRRDLPPPRALTPSKRKQWTAL